MPPAESTKERGWLLESKEIADVSTRIAWLLEVLDRQLGADVVNDHFEGGPLRGKATFEGPSTDVKSAGCALCANAIYQTCYKNHFFLFPGGLHSGVVTRL